MWTVCPALRMRLTKKLGEASTAEMVQIDSALRAVLDV
jgi:mRNA-degrading endonuclease toxin of MazEF toxin-antitoxin module